MADKFITEARLGSLIKFSPYTMAAWRKAGEMPKALQINQQFHYTHADADNWLFSKCQHVSVGDAPTVARLLDRCLVLLTTKEVFERFAAKGGTVGRKLLFNQATSRKWPLAAFSATDYRFFAHTVDEAAATFAVPTHPTSRLEHIIGLKKEEVRTLIQQGALTTFDVFGGKEVHVTEESLCALLQECLPGGMSARDWLDDRARSRRPLVSARRAGLMLNIDADRIVRRILAGDLVHIRLPSGQYRIPAEAISALRGTLSPRNFSQPRSVRAAQ